MLVATTIDLILVTKRRVLGDVDALLLMEVHELLLLKPRMQFHLVDRWDYICMLEDTLDFLLGKVADSNSPDFTILYKLLHSFVGLRLSAHTFGECWQDATHINIVNVVSDDIPILVLGEHLISALKRNGPVHQEKIKVLNAQVIQ